MPFAASLFSLLLSFLPHSHVFLLNLRYTVSQHCFFIPIAQKSCCAIFLLLCAFHRSLIQKDILGPEWETLGQNPFILSLSSSLPLFQFSTAASSVLALFLRKARFTY